MTKKPFTDKDFLHTLYNAIEVLMEEQQCSFDTLNEKSGIDVQALLSGQDNIDISTLKVISGSFGLSLSAFFRKMEEVG
jgi:hypothetical protein